MGCAGSPGRRGRYVVGPARAARAAAHRPHPGVRRHGVPRGRGQVGAEPGAGQLAGSVPLDGQPLPRLLARLRVLPRRRHPRPARRRADPADRRAAGRRRGARHGAGRRTAAATCRTTVRAHWSTSKPAYRVRLAGGHRADGQRRAPVPHRARLAARHRRMVPVGPPPPAAARATCCSAPGSFGQPRPHTAGYRRGYLCGLVRGDEDPAAGRSFPSVELGAGSAGPGPPLPGRGPVGRPVRPCRWVRRPGGGRAGSEPGRIARRPDAADGTSIADALRWPAAPGDDWCAGFLGGLIDARGRAVARRAADPAAPTTSCSAGRPGPCTGSGSGSGSSATGGARSVRLLGGAAELLRLLQLVDPAVFARRDLAGAPVDGRPGTGGGLGAAGRRAVGCTTSPPAPATSWPSG